MTNILFTICNTSILFAWASVLFFPKSILSKYLISFPWVPLLLSFFYIYFLVFSGGIMDADFSSLKGILKLFKEATPESAAAGWLHYLAFDFWVGTWIIRNSQKNEIKHLYIILPLLFTFMLGPVGILAYSVVYFSKKLKKAS